MRDRRPSTRLEQAEIVVVSLVVGAATLAFLVDIARAIISHWLG